MDPGYGSLPITLRPDVRGSEAIPISASFLSSSVVRCRVCDHRSPTRHSRRRRLRRPGPTKHWSLSPLGLQRSDDCGSPTSFDSSINNLGKDRLTDAERAQRIYNFAYIGASPFNRKGTPRQQFKQAHLRNPTTLTTRYPSIALSVPDLNHLVTHR